MANNLITINHELTILPSSMPLRRYLRITKHSTLELRIHVIGSDPSWFNDRMLREALQLIKPLVLPKLREERANKKRKKNPTKDVVQGGLCSLNTADDRRLLC